MPIAWTAEQIIALAPDPSSAKAGSALANRSKWLALGCSARALWGACQGSGKNPYQTQIDLSEPAFQCSCPSRKFPCKHGLGLFLLFVAQEAAFTKQEPPTWVGEWLVKRDARAEQRVKKEESEERNVDPNAHLKRAEQRARKVEQGIVELQQWLRDLVRQGLAAAQTKPYQFWEAQAARLVDAQAAGLARMLRQMAGLAASGEGWQHRLLERLSRLQLLLEGYQRLDSLPFETQADIRQLIGWNPVQEELLAQDGVRDTWLVLGQRVYEEEKLRAQRSWLYGCESRRSALLLQFAFGRDNFDITVLAGLGLEAELVFFPSAYPLRALLKQRGEINKAFDAEFSAASVLEIYEARAAALARNPWLELLPVTLSAVTPLRVNEQWLVQDAKGKSLRLSKQFDKGWELLALSGGRALQLFGEWNGEQLFPLSVWVEGKFFRLS
ncbi:MAG: SWIM zinc finger family protein [Acidobacteria bacterium]|nr:SWIM zinc finger family protein [Acidobacteriota bacterium]